MQRRDRGRFGRLQHHRVPAGQRRGDLPRGHEEGEIPRDHLRRDPERGGLPAGEGILELVGPARVMEEMRRDQGQVEIAALADRLAAVHRLEHGEFASLLLEEPGDAEKVFATLRRSHRSPCFFKGTPRAFHRRVEVGLPRLGDEGVPFARRGIDRGEILPRLRRDELAVDEELVALFQRHRKGLRDGAYSSAAAKVRSGVDFFGCFIPSQNTPHSDTGPPPSSRSASPHRGAASSPRSGRDPA